MPSVSEQLQKYRLMHNNAETRPAASKPCVIEWQHPSTRDYFRNLMKQWRKNALHDRLATQRD